MAISFAHLKALIVEDNVHMRTLLKSVLKSFDLREVYEASDGEDGISEMLAIRPDLILTDYNMAPMDGVEFTRRVRSPSDSPNPYTPIIMITGHTESSYVEAARDAGVTELLAKPITPRNLYIRLAEIIERPRPFVRCTNYFGPDRRRRTRADYTGPRRRTSDASEFEIL